MTIKRRAATRYSSTAIAMLLLIIILVGAACDAGGPVPPASSTATVAKGTPSRTTAAATAVTGGTGGAPTPQGNKANSKLDCQALANALLDLETNQPFLTALVGGGGSVVNRPDSPFYVDTARVRADLDILAALPDPTDSTELSIFGKPSESISQYRQLLDIVDRNAKADAAGTPVSTPSGGGSMSDKQLLDFTGLLVKMYGSLYSAMDHSCPGVSATPPAGGQPNSQATPLKASYSIGQTAPVGALRVTLDKVVTLPGADAIQPTPGNRFVFAYVTIENTGKTPFGLNALLEMYFEDAAGKQYFGDPYSGSLDTEATNNLSTELKPGEKRSGAAGFQLPRNAGDLVWVFKDFRPNLAVFSVKASDVAAVGAPVTEPTANAMREGASATQTAFANFVLSAAATQEAAGTETPAPPEPTDTAAPPEATDTPAPTEVGDTPTANP